MFPWGKKLSLYMEGFKYNRAPKISEVTRTPCIYDPKTTNQLFTHPNNQQGLRQHFYKVNKEHTNKKQYQSFFTNRIVNCWNSLPENVVYSSSVNIFKNEIDRHFQSYMYLTNLSHLY